MALTINGGASVLRLLNNLNQVQSERAVTLARLSTMKRINKASDDPAGLIALNSLNSELASVDAALANNQRSKSLLDTAAGALAEVSTLVSEIERLAVASGGNTLSADELAANQAQIDSAIESIDRIINTAGFNGQELFTGENRITVTMTAADAADLKDVRVHSRAPTDGTTSLSVNVTTAAQRATTSGTVVADISSALSAATTLTIGGKDGTSTLTLTSGSNLASVISQINAAKGETGVSATSSGTQLKLTSVDYGEDAFVSISAVSGDADVLATANVSKVTGSDAVVTVNGAAASVSGTEIHYSGNGLSFSANLADNTTGTRTINITGGGAIFQIGTDAHSRAVLGLGNLTSGYLGRSDLGYLSDLKSGGSAALASDPGSAALIARKAGLLVATQSARIGGFIRYQLDGTTNALNTMKENLTDAVGAIEDADVALETSRLERQNLLASTAMSLLEMVYAEKRTVLGLLG